jgi:membrane dipeptidase
VSDDHGEVGRETRKACLRTEAVRAESLHAEALVLDSHVDTAMRFNEDGFDFMTRNAEGHVDLPRIREGGLDALVMAVYLGEEKEEAYRPRLVDRACERIAWIHSLEENHPETVCLATAASQVRRAAETGRVALLIGIEGGHIINGSLDVLRRFFRLGVRILTVTHVFHHDWADSAGFGELLEPRHGGLAPFGRTVVEEMNRLGMVIDVSHVSDETFRDVLALSTAPVVASHSGCRALCDHPRNLSDGMISSLAEKGGVIQIPFYPRFIDPGFERRQKAGDRAGTPLELLLDHVEHVIAVAGSDHVGLGSDWDGIPFTVAGVEDCSKMPAVTAGLLARGLDETSIKKILGGNFLRVLETCCGV